MVALQAFILAAALASPGDTVLLDFSADWCGPCKLMQPTVERLREAGYPVRRIDVDRQPQVAQQFSVRPIPCFVLVVNGREVNRIVGPASFDRLAQMFHQAGFRPGTPGPAASTAATSSARTLGQLQPIAPPATAAGTRRTISPPVVAQPGGGGAAPQLTSLSSPAARSGSMRAAQQRALAATVRLKVSDPTGDSFGTGTIIDTHGDEALVLTCGHLFRESRGKGTIMVDLFAPGARGPVPGQLLAYEADRRDIGLVVIRPGVAVVPARVAPTSFHPRLDDPVFNIGCDHGAAPTIRTTTISAIDRYVGPPNIEVRGEPVEGRSGGGLFNADGNLIGICNAADPKEDRGIYAGLPTVQLKLKELHLAHIYQHPSAPPPASTPATVPTALAATSSPPTPGAAPQVLPTSTTSRETPGSAADNRDIEVICIVRSRSNPAATSRVVVLEQPSPQLLRSIVGQATTSAHDVERLATLPRDRMTRPARNAPADHSGTPIIRAQNR